MQFFRSKPVLSIVLIVYKMPDQAERTLQSLSPRYQQGVKEGDYEVIVVENDSDSILGETRATLFASNVRYFHRHETQRTPVHAINFGAAQASGSHVAIMIDGARMLTPGIVRQILDVFKIAPHAAVSAPGYHLGDKLQQIAVNEGYNEDAEAELLKRIQWPQDGYRLFDIAVFSGSCQGGFFQANHESNCIATSFKRWKQVGGMNARYDDFGGGMANLDLYKRLLEFPETPLYVLYGEGSFHQFHGGVTTGTLKAERDQIFLQIKQQDHAIRGDKNSAPQAKPILFGSAHPSVYRFIRYSLDRVDPL